MRNPVLIALTLGIGTAALVGCGNHTASSGPATLASLPMLTGPSRALTTGVVTRGGFVQQAASKGVPLKSWSSFFASGGTSRAFCEVGNGLKNLYRNAEHVDRLKCALGAVEATGAFGPLLYDGNEHYLNLQNVAGKNVALKIIAEKNNDGMVVHLRFWSGWGSSAQTEYYDYQTDGGRIHLETVSVSGTARQRTRVQGSANSAGLWTTTKQIDAISLNDGADAGGNRWSNQQQTTINEANEALEVTDSQQNAFTPNGATAAIPNALVATGVLQLLNTPNARLDSLALGGGTFKYDTRWGTNASGPQVVGWAGDTGAPLATGVHVDYLETVQARDLPAAVGDLSVAFAAEQGEQWDLQPPKDTTPPNFDFAAQTPAFNQAASTCEANYAFSDESWVDCHALP